MTSFTRPRPVAGDDDLRAFDCGETSLNRWLVERATRNETSGASRTFVSTNVNDGSIAGYYCLSAASLEGEKANARLRRNMPTPIPTILLGRLAIDLRFQGEGLGAALLQNAVMRSVLAARTIGAAAIMVHALDAAASDFYFRHGFSALAGSDPRMLYLPLTEAMETFKTL